MCFWKLTVKPVPYLVPRTGSCGPARALSGLSLASPLPGPLSPPRLLRELLGPGLGDAGRAFLQLVFIPCCGVKLRIYWINNALRSPGPPSPACKSGLSAVGVGGGGLQPPPVFLRCLCWLRRTLCRAQHSQDPGVDAVKLRAFQSPPKAKLQGEGEPRGQSSRRVPCTDHAHCPQVSPGPM